MKLFLCFGVFAVLAVSTFASDLKIEKQKLKLSYEYENFVDFDGNEVATSGLKGTYLFKARADVHNALYLNVDYQTGIKWNFVTDFRSGELPAWMWSNRLTATATFPIKKFFAGSTFFFRNNLLADVSDGNEFFDVFGGEEFRELSGTIQGGVKFTPQWEFSVSGQKYDLEFLDFPLSNSSAIGAAMRLSYHIEKTKWNIDYRIRSIDFERPLFFPDTVFFPIGDLLLQHDHFWELGASVEFFHPFYLSAGYAYQNNESNNPGFSYHNNRFSFVIGTELTESIHLQAYGTASLQNFLQEDASLPFPVVSNENDNSTMAASITKSFNHAHELEVGFQRLNYNSSFTELDTSKYILYVAYNLRL